MLVESAKNCTIYAFTENCNVSAPEQLSVCSSLLSLVDGPFNRNVIAILHFAIVTRGVRQCAGTEVPRLKRT
jgi:hypothetical protein